MSSPRLSLDIDGDICWIFGMPGRDKFISELHCASSELRTLEAIVLELKIIVACWQNCHYKSSFVIYNVVCVVLLDHFQRFYWTNSKDD